MNKFFLRLSAIYAAGTVGAVVNSLAIWLFGRLGMAALLGVKIAPALTTAWLYPRLVWGGLWALLFFIPLFEKRWILRGLLWSLGPTLAQLFYFFPVVAQKGMMGLALGTLTPAFVVFFNAIWGVAASWWLSVCDKETSRR